MSTGLVVVGLPHNKLAYTNAVFVNPSELPRFQSGGEMDYMQIKGGMVYTVRAHEGVGRGEVAMNAKQRECTKVSQRSTHG